jgi:hypothetical protein
MALLVLFDLKITPETNILLLVWLLPCCLLFGLSGFLILRRNEYVNQFGKLTSGFWARFNGILGIVFGWGSAILIIIIVVFDLK